VTEPLPGDLLDPAGRERLAARLWEYVREQRWFRAKARPVRGARVADLIALGKSVLVVLEIDYQAGEPDLYAVPLASGRPAIDGPDLLAVVRDGRTLRGERGELRGESSPLLGEIATGPLEPKAAQGEQTNSTITFGDRLLLKVYRQLDAGENPELEVGRFLTRHCQPPCVPRVLGALFYRTSGESRSLGIVHELVPNEGDAWTLALAEARAFLEQAEGKAPAGDADLLARALAPAPAAVGRFAALAGTLGRRTGELHLALGNGHGDPAFAPEPLTAADRHALVTRALSMLEHNLVALAAVQGRIPAAARPMAERLLASRPLLEWLLAQLAEQDFPLLKIRTHGDLHLGQVLVRGDDFMIIDFEGEPARPLAERRAKSSPLRDAMGMVRSFDYAAAEAVRALPGREPWAALWAREVAAAYLRGYLATVEGAPFMPCSSEELAVLCTFFQLEKAIYEIGYEANNRPDWVEIPLRGLLSLARLWP
jgi:trehalose synthase-fused probable maltokinase